MRVVPLESEQTFQDMSLSVFHATTHTFSATSAAKIVESHSGKAFIKHFAQRSLRAADPSA